MNFALGYELKDDRMSAEAADPNPAHPPERRLGFSIRPSFLMPYMTARTADVEGPLFLRKFGVPFWALARVFGGDPMSWYRMECGLGRFSVVGTTVRTATLPEHLLADEHHQGLDGREGLHRHDRRQRVLPGAEPAEAAGSDKLKVAYQVFKDEACDVSPEYAPKTVSTDGWKGTQAAWKMLSTKVVILLCFLHGWLRSATGPNTLKRCLPKSPGGFRIPIMRPTAGVFAQRLRSLRQWAAGHLTGIVLEKVLDLCDKRDRWSIAYRHPGGHRTSNMLDRLMRGMNRYFDQGQHLHGSLEACRLHCRAWALLCNFTPWHPAVAGENQGWRCPAERLNQHRYHDCWLQNLLISASLGDTDVQPQNQ